MVAVKLDMNCKNDKPKETLDNTKIYIEDDEFEPDESDSEQDNRGLYVKLIYVSELFFIFFVTVQYSVRSDIDFTSSWAISSYLLYHLMVYLISVTAVKVKYERDNLGKEQLTNKYLPAFIASQIFVALGAMWFRPDWIGVLLAEIFAMYLFGTVSIETELETKKLREKYYSNYSNLIKMQSVRNRTIGLLGKRRKISDTKLMYKLYSRKGRKLNDFYIVTRVSTRRGNTRSEEVTGKISIKSKSFIVHKPEMFNLQSKSLDK